MRASQQIFGLHGKDAPKFGFGMTRLVGFKESDSVHQIEIDLADQHRPKRPELGESLCRLFTVEEIGRRAQRRFVAVADRGKCRADAGRHGHEDRADEHGKNARMNDCHAAHETFATAQRPRRR